VCLPYSIANLHRMATELGIKRCWFHASAKYPHYNIPQRRIQDISAHCTIVPTRVILNIATGVSQDL
jgi:hypothetical protein